MSMKLSCTVSMLYIQYEQGHAFAIPNVQRHDEHSECHCMLPTESTQMANVTKAICETLHN